MANGLRNGCSCIGSHREVERDNRIATVGCCDGAIVGSCGSQRLRVKAEGSALAYGLRNGCCCIGSHREVEGDHRIATVGGRDSPIVGSCGGQRLRAKAEGLTLANGL